MSHEQDRTLVQEVYVPPREARVVAVTAGQVLEIVDLQGRQVGDLMAYRIDDPDEYLSPAHTCAVVGKLYPEVGDAFYSNRRTPIMRVRRDDAGRHSLLISCCDPNRYVKEFGAPADHPSCLTSIQRALAAYGSTWQPRGELTWNVFMNDQVEGTRIVTYPPVQGAGALIALEILVELVICLSACPQDLTPCNDYNPTDMAMRVWERAT
jgi:uncharacterized protein YcgI (DUF1989 family)